MMTVSAPALVLTGVDEPQPATVNVSQLEDEICQLLADLLRFHLKVPNGELVVNTRNGKFSYARLTIGREPQVQYPEVFLSSAS